MSRLILLPGLDGTSELFEPVVSELRDRCIVTSIRYPMDAQMGYAELIEFVDAQLPQHEPFLILGESFSGPIAIALATRHRATIKGLILVCTFAWFPSRWLGVFTPWLGMIPFHRLPVRLISFFMLGKFSTPKSDNMLRKVFEQLTNRVLATRLREVLRVDLCHRLAELTQVPTLYLRARHDRLIASAASADIMRHLPTLQLVSLDAPHMLLQACPQEAAQAILRFVEEKT